MKKAFFLLTFYTLAFATHGQTSNEEQLIKETVRSFITSWNRHDFKDMPNYTTKDVSWIMGPGSWMQGRDQVQKGYQLMHEKIMKNTPLTEESMHTRFITTDVALVTLVVKTGAFYSPDGVDRGNNKMGDSKEIRTLVAVKQDGKWLLTSGQSSTIRETIPVN